MWRHVLLLLALHQVATAQFEVVRTVKRAPNSCPVFIPSSCGDLKGIAGPEGEIEIVDEIYNPEDDAGLEGRDLPGWAVGSHYSLPRASKNKDDDDKYFFCDVADTSATAPPNAVKKIYYKPETYTSARLIPIYDYADKDKCDNFGLKITSGKNPIKALKAWTGKEFPVEHVLEMQLLMRYLKQELQTRIPPPPDGIQPSYSRKDNAWWKDQDPNHPNFPDLKKQQLGDNRCEYVYRYWEPVKINTGDPKLGSVRAWDAVALAYPNTKVDAATTKSEFIRVAREINDQKMRCWSDFWHCVNPDFWNDFDKHGVKASNKNPTHAEVTAALNAADKMMKKLRLVIMTTKYLSDPQIAATFLKQANRVGDKLGTVEDAVVKYWKDHKPPGMYKSLDLKTGWTKFMKEATTRFNNEFITAMTEMSKRLEEQADRGEKYDLDPKNTVKLPQALKDMVKHMKATAAEAQLYINRKYAFTNPF